MLLEKIAEFVRTMFYDASSASMGGVVFPQNITGVLTCPGIVRRIGGPRGRAGMGGAAYRRRLGNVLFLPARRQGDDGTPSGLALFYWSR